MSSAERARVIYLRTTAGAHVGSDDERVRAMFDTINDELTAGR